MLAFSHIKLCLILYIYICFQKYIKGLESKRFTAPPKAQLCKREGNERSPTNETSLSTLTQQASLGAVPKQLGGGERVRVVACGGDGTVVWVLSELAKRGCASVPVAVTPFGTGNDMARVLGEGGTAPSQLFGDGLSALRRRVLAVARVSIIPLDVWSLEFISGEGGVFYAASLFRKTHTHAVRRRTLFLTRVVIPYISNEHTVFG